MVRREKRQYVSERTIDVYYSWHLRFSLKRARSHAKAAEAIKKGFYTGFEKVVAQNRGVYSESFFTLDETLDWLASPRGSELCGLFMLHM